jgi:hypothetical protein
MDARTAYLRSQPKVVQRTTEKDFVYPSATDSEPAVAAGGASRRSLLPANQVQNLMHRLRALKGP